MPGSRACAVFAALVLPLLCANTSVPGLVMRVYGYGICLYLQQYRKLTCSYDPLFAEFVDLLGEESPGGELWTLCTGESFQDELARALYRRGLCIVAPRDMRTISAILPMHRARAADAGKALQMVENECVALVARMFVDGGYYSVDLNSDPLFMAAKALQMEWLIRRFTEMVTLVCRDAIAVHERLWVFETFCGPYAGPEAGNAAQIRGYSSNTVKIFLKIIKDDMPDRDIGCDTFYELLDFADLVVHREEAVFWMYSKLATRGLLGRGSGEIMGGKPKTSRGQRQPSKAWHVMLAEVAGFFGIGIEIEDDLVRLVCGSGGPIDPAEADLARIRTLEWDMGIDLGAVESGIRLEEVLAFVFGRLDGIEELIFTGSQSGGLDAGVFGRIFTSLGGVTELRFLDVEASMFYKMVGAFGGDRIRGLHISDVPVASDLSFIEGFASIERLEMEGCELDFVAISTLVSRIRVRSGIRMLRLTKNDLSGLSDLTCIAGLRSLGKLIIDCCRLNLESLDALSEIRNLKVLNLDGNNLFRLASFLVVKKLPLLEELSAEDCKLTSGPLNTLSQIGIHNSLETLRLCGNSFDGPINFSFVANLVALRRLDMSGCELSAESEGALAEIMKKFNLTT